MNICTSRAAVGALILPLVGSTILYPNHVSADQVTLVALNDNTTIVGEFIEFRGGNYVVDTELGKLKFASKGVICQGAVCPSIQPFASTISFTGSHSLGQGVMPLLLEGYAGHLNAQMTVSEAKIPDEIKADMIGDNGYGDDLGTYRVSSQTTELGFAEFISRQNAVSMASRRINPTEARALRNAGKGNMVSADQEHMLGFDSLVVIANPGNPLSTIAIDDLQAIYSGTLTNWSELGDEDRPITILNQDESTGAQAIFNQQLFGDTPPPALQDGITAPDSKKVSDLVNENPGAIGFVNYAQQRGAKPLSLINACGITLHPDPFSVKTKEYVFEQPLYLYTANDAGHNIRDFITFATSPMADTLIAKSGFVDLGIVSRPQSLNSARAKALKTANVDAFEASVIRDMLDRMDNTARLSTTFRFRPGSLRLDELGQRTLERLVGYLRNQPAGTKVQLVGFTDNVGAFDANKRIGLDRAQHMIKLLQETAGDQIAHVEFSASGFGEISPTACNSTERGRDINRRVEVWVSQ